MFISFVSRNSYSSYYRQLILLGLPIVIGQLGSIVLAFADTLMIGHHSTIELAAAAFVNNMFNLVIIFALGFSYAVTPTVGTLYGRCENEKIGEVVKNAVLANLLLAASLVVVMTVFYACIGLMGQPIELLPYIRPYFLVIFVFRNDLGGLFTDSKEVARLVAMTVIPFVIYQFGDALQIVFGNSLRGLSYVRPLVLYAFIAYFIVSLPLSYLFGIVMNMGLIGVWFSFPFGLTTAGLLYLMAFRKRLREIEQN